MQRFVVDASVILKWVLPSDAEPFQEQALAVARALTEGRIEVCVPSLWYFEVGNILTRKYRADADQDLHDLALQLGPGERPVSPAWQREILRLTTTYPVTFSDAAYHALAVVENGVFITADEKYLQAVHGEAKVLHLKEWR